MQRFWSANGGAENLIYIVVGVIWVVIQIAAQSAKRRKRDLPLPPPPPAPPGESRPPPSVLDPEDELRRFLRELSGESAPPPMAPPPPVAPPPPAFASPPPPPAARRFAPPAARRWISRVRPASAPPLPAKAAAARAPAIEKAREEPPTAADTGMPVFSELSAAAYQGVALRPLVADRHRRRVTLSMGRATLQRAVLYQTLLGAPRATEPYR